MLLPLASLLVGGAALAAGCGGDTDVSKTVKDVTPGSGGATATATRPSLSVGGTTGGPEKESRGLASQVVPAIDEMPTGMKVSASDSFTLNLGTFTSSYLFTNNLQGEEKANAWRIVDGYQVSYEPNGLDADLLRGRYYVRAEAYLFQTIEGATEAYDFMDKFYLARPATQKVPTKQLANQSNAYKLLNGTVGTSDQLAAYYRMLVRRGNAVFVVQVNGSDKFINVDQARDIAVIMDDRVLGIRANPVPTPIPTPRIGGQLPTPAAAATSGGR
ncbi:MAG: hypothetical protein ABIP13_11800 [Tepidiformaceae bacterium]